MNSVALITVEFNSTAHTVELIKSLENVDLKDLKLDVVVVNNGSKEMIDYSSSKLTITNLKTDKNLGFTGGNNLGISHALSHFRPDYILLLNNDTLVDPSFLSHLVNYAKEKNNVGAVSPMIYFAKGYEFHKHSYTKDELGKVVWFAGGSIDWQNMYAFHRGVDEVDRGQFRTQSSELRVNNSRMEKKNLPLVNTTTMDFATGCCMLIPTKVLEEVGLFDDSYFLYWEDVDLSQRIRQAGYKLYFCEESIIWHKNAGSSGGSGSKLHQHYQERNRQKFAWKYAPWRTKLSLLRRH